MSQEPWNEEIYHSTESRRSRSTKGSSGTRVLSILAILFLFIVIVTTIAMVYLSHGGSKTDANQEFYSSSTKVSVSSTNTDASRASASNASQSSTSTSESSSSVESTPPSSAASGETIAVQAGEGRDMIAARAGISPEELERLNPDKMTGPGGTWWANPGDLVKIK
ncbi:MULTISPECIES: SAG1386/EF1546 family surface-associated protein [unclassified Streptococcus]|uniref:SAG1386/EF1546 family surface-associated protein n=1 Tax=unclassified Streptococcus TaxID=2608887 RepID=UPI0010724095|nr:MULTISPECIES: SAG1386/EF1546 family surface-associated protein [unclassified Streptococcus]MBF0786599.1 hypothetical protein [Streptococcus sp. 19428wC2_LYSM12]MCQ9210908.1 hypothetical protein [Streptococcus sp. B01]MCQ9214177.1 hypothetical protein [Streptococcus sp. O1]TFV06560.1 hypothetical protein E4T79_01470 [Streptococcus sp. LYSM12]